MRKEITYSQKRAIIIGKELAEQITTNSQLAEVFLEKIKNIPADKKYADIIKEVLPRHKKIKTLSCKTLRSIAQNALKTLLSDKERKEIITKSRQRGGRNSVAKLQKEKGIKVLDPREKNLLNDIGRNPGEYKKNTVRDIAKIQKELKEKLGRERKRSTIKSYMRQFEGTKKKLIFWEDYPEEIKDLKKLYEKYINPDKKLPTKLIMNELNMIHHHDRNENAIENYIRNHWKTEQEKEVMRSEIWGKEEKEFIRQIVRNKEEYTVKQGRGMGGYNLARIFKEFKLAFPKSTRNCKGIRHQISKQEEYIKKQEKKQTIER